MQLGGGVVVADPRPGGGEAGEAHGGGVEDARDIAHMPAQGTRRGGGHMRGELGKERGRPLGVGVGQCGAGHAARPGMVEPRAVAGQARLDAAQRARPGELAEQGEELVPAGQPPHAAVGAMLLDEPVEDRPRNLLGQLVKDGIVLAHGVDPRLGPKRGETSGAK
jgi:hypothetical protein